MIRLHPQPIPVEPFEIGLVHSRENFLCDRSVLIAISAHRESRRLHDAPFRHGDPFRTRHASAKLSGKIHPHAGEPLEEGIHAEQRAASEARLPNRLARQSRGSINIGNIIVVAENAQGI